MSTNEIIRELRIASAAAHSHWMRVKDRDEDVTHEACARHAWENLERILADVREQDAVHDDADEALARALFEAFWRTEYPFDEPSEEWLRVARAAREHIADWRADEVDRLRAEIKSLIEYPTWHRGMYGCPRDMVSADRLLNLLEGGQS